MTGLRIGSLFAGIGGFDLAARWMGWETAWFSEIDPYASAILAKHWPKVPNYGDITEIDFTTVPAVDLLCGGFPCQDISHAGRREGIGGQRSGLWGEFARAIRGLRPRYVVVENVAALLGRGIERVLGDLAASGYDAEWQILSAAAVGAPHLRERVWIVAYPHGRCGPDRLLESRISSAIPPEVPVGVVHRGHVREDLADAECGGVPDPRSGAAAGTPSGLQGETQERQWLRPDAGECGDLGDEQNVADPNLTGLEGWYSGSLQERTRQQPAGSGGASTEVADAARQCLDRSGNSRATGWPESPDRSRHYPGFDHPGRAPWAVEPNVGRVAHGIPNRVDRLRCLGNAIVPHCAYVIFQAIQAADERMRAIA